MVGINPEVRTDVFSVVSGAEFIGRSHCLVDLIHVPECQYDLALRATFKGEDLSVDWGRGFFPGVGTSLFGISGEEMRSSWMVKVTLKGMERRLFRRR
jgi:hypothetical protein